MVCIVETYYNIEKHLANVLSELTERNFAKFSTGVQYRLTTTVITPGDSLAQARRHVLLITPYHALFHSCTFPVLRSL